MNSIKFNSVKVEPPRPDHRPAAEEQPVVVEGLNARGKGLRASQIKIGLATIMETGFGDRPVPAFLRIPPGPYWPSRCFQLGIKVRIGKQSNCHNEQPYGNNFLSLLFGLPPISPGR